MTNAIRVYGQFSDCFIRFLSEVTVPINKEITVLVCEGKWLYTGRVRQDGFHVTLAKRVQQPGEKNEDGYPLPESYYTGEIILS